MPLVLDPCNPTNNVARTLNAKEWRLLAKQRHIDPFTVLIISGHCGSRGTTFNDRDHCTNPESAMNLTDFYVSFPDSASGENIVQTSNRVSGTYPKHPLIRLWTSDRDWNLIEKTHDEIDVVYLVLSHHPNLAP